MNCSQLEIFDILLSLENGDVCSCDGVNFCFLFEENSRLQFNRFSVVLS